MANKVDELLTQFDRTEKEAKLLDDFEKRK